MKEFSTYFSEYLITLLNNFLYFLKSIWSIIYKSLWLDIFGGNDILTNKNVEGYFPQLYSYFDDFGNNIIAWIFEIIAIIVNVAFFGFLALRIFQLMRRYIRFVRKEIEKDALLEEIANLNLRTAQLIDEKNKIMALKVSSMGFGGLPQPGAEPQAGGAGATGDKKGEKKVVTGSRFSKLIAVDEKYETELCNIMMEPDDMLPLPELVDRFINYAANQLHLFYTRKVIRTFFAGLATSKIIILEGISGTGKTSLPYAMGKFFKNPSAIVSVQPSWRDRAEMIGYLNEFTKRFNETDFLKSLYEVLYREDLNFIVLDEMNLARIEYYFAEFLSIMEMPNKDEWLIDIVPDSQPSDPKFLIDGKILVPQNVWFIGTANRDDSTYTITDKVYDRAVSIEMNNRADFIDAPFTPDINMTYDYFKELCVKGQEENPISQKSLEKLSKLDEFIADNFKITFGNRILKQIKLFVPAYVACGGEEIDGLDYIVLRKIFRKFETLNIAFLKDEIAELISLLDKLFGKGAFAESIRYLQELAKNA